MESKIESEQLIAYLETKRDKLQKAAKHEVCSSIRAECRDQAIGYQIAIQDISNWLKHRGEDEKEDQ